MSKLSIFPSGDKSLLVSRDFRASSQSLFDAHTQSALIQKWLLGPPGWEMPVCETDLRVGGTYRWVWRRTSTGEEMGIRGEYLEVVPPTRLANTEKFDVPWYEGECVVTLELADLGEGRSRLTSTMTYESEEVRNSVMEAGMAAGLQASYERLEKLVIEKS